MIRRKSKDLKFCINCVHYSENSSDVPMCKLSLSLVTGAPSYTCEIERAANTDGCGSKGKYWEEKKQEKDLPKVYYCKSCQDFTKLCICP